VPFYLATREFFELVRSHLAPGGLLALNVATVPGDDQLVDGIAGTVASVFPETRIWPALKFNHFVIGLTRPLRGVRPIPVPLLGDLLAKQLSDPVAPAADPWTDDRAPVEWVTDRIILRYAAEGGRLDEQHLPTAPR
jgi:hypothetical protein